MDLSQLIQMGCYKTEPKGKSARNRAIYNPDKVRWSEGGDEGKTERGRQPLMLKARTRLLGSRIWKRASPALQPPDKGSVAVSLTLPFIPVL